MYCSNNRAHLEAMELQDENRHGDFFTAILKARSEFVDSNDWQVGVNWTHSAQVPAGISVPAAAGPSAAELLRTVHGLQSQAASEVF